MDRHCAFCGAALARHANEPAREWHCRRFCGYSCAVRARSAVKAQQAAERAAAQTRQCARCGATFARRVGEAPRRWTARLFCSRECSNRTASEGQRLGWHEEDRGYATPCWIWDGTPNVKGYCKVTRDGRSIPAHRFVYIERRGPIPDGLELDHLCEVTVCVNPDHLDPVTRGENTARSWQRGRHDAKRKTSTRPVASGEV